MSYQSGNPTPRIYSNPPVAELILSVLGRNPTKMMTTRSIANQINTPVAETRRVLNSLVAKDLVGRKTEVITKTKNPGTDSIGRAKRNSDAIVFVYCLIQK